MTKKKHRKVLFHSYAWKAIFYEYLILLLLFKIISIALPYYAEKEKRLRNVAAKHHSLT